MPQLPRRLPDRDRTPRLTCAGSGYPVPTRPTYPAAPIATDVSNPASTGRPVRPYKPIRSTSRAVSLAPHPTCQPIPLATPAPRRPDPGVPDTTPTPPPPTSHGPPTDRPTQASPPDMSTHRLPHDGPCQAPAHDRTVPTPHTPIPTPPADRAPAAHHLTTQSSIQSQHPPHPSRHSHPVRALAVPRHERPAHTPGSDDPDPHHPPVPPRTTPLSAPTCHFRVDPTRPTPPDYLSRPHPCPLPTTRPMAWPPTSADTPDHCSPHPTNLAHPVRSTGLTVCGTAPASTARPLARRAPRPARQPWPTQPMRSHPADAPDRSRPPRPGRHPRPLLPPATSRPTRHWPACAYRPIRPGTTRLPRPRTPFPTPADQTSHGTATRAAPPDFPSRPSSPPLRT